MKHVVALLAPKLRARWEATLAELYESGLPAAVFTLRALNNTAPIVNSNNTAGVMIHARSCYRRAIAQCIAKREGAIIPVISCVSPRELLLQTLVEKTVSIDTTAAGGNASLMTMSA